MVDKEDSMSNAAARLDMAVQTVSTQVRELERDLGCKLLRPAGRGLALTEAGVVVLRQAESIFQLGEALPELVGAAAQSPSVRLVGPVMGCRRTTTPSAPSASWRNRWCRDRLEWARRLTH